MKITANLIMSLNPCSKWTEDLVRAAVPDPISVQCFLSVKSIPPADRLWVVLHKEFISANKARKFACGCALHGFSLAHVAGYAVSLQVQRVVDVASKFSYGRATDADLMEVRRIAEFNMYSGECHIDNCILALSTVLDNPWDAALYSSINSARIVELRYLGFPRNLNSRSREFNRQCTYLKRLIRVKERVGKCHQSTC